VDVKPDGCQVCFASDASNILVEIVFSQNVTVLHEGVGVGCFINEENGVAGVNFLDILEFMEKSLDGK
jgi:hypothetical protein